MSVPLGAQDYVRLTGRELLVLTDCSRLSLLHIDSAEALSSRFPWEFMASARKIDRLDLFLLVLVLFSDSFLIRL